MKILKPLFLLIGRALVFIGIPLALIYVINAIYPGLLQERYVRTLAMAMYLGIPIVLLYFIADAFDGLWSMVAEIAALSLVLVYTLLILGYGTAHLSYENVSISLVYPLLLYIIMAGVLVRFPTPVLRYLAWKSENAPQSSEKRP